MLKRVMTLTFWIKDQKLNMKGLNKYQNLLTLVNPTPNPNLDLQMPKTLSKLLNKHLNLKLQASANLSPKPNLGLHMSTNELIGFENGKFRKCGTN